MVVVPERIVEAGRFVVFGSPLARLDPGILAEPLAAFTPLPSTAPTPCCMDRHQA